MIRDTKKSSVRGIAKTTGKAKSQVHRDIAAGKITPESAETTAELYRRELELKIQERARRVELHQLKIDETRRHLLPAGMVADLLTRTLAILFSSTDFLLLSRLPQINAGLGAAEQRANNEAECNEIRKRIQDEVDMFLRGLETKGNE